MIVLYNPWSTHSERKPLPMSLLAVASKLEGEFDYEIVDGNLEADPVARIVQIARRRGAIAIGVTVMPGPQLSHAVVDSRRLKRQLPGIPIIWGGYFPSQHASVVLRDEAIDFCIGGQGELSTLQLMRALRSGGAVDGIAGLSRRDGGSIQHTPIGPLTPLDELPLWPYQRVPLERYVHSHYLGERVTMHHSSYGCPHGCSFCAVVGIARRRWVAESPARTEQVLRYHQQRCGADAVQFHDMDFFISEARVVEIADRMRGMDMRWWALGRVDELMRYSESSWQAMKRSGLKMVFCGAETGSAVAMRMMNKGGDVSGGRTLELARRMRHYGIVPEFSFVLGSPPDPLEDVDATLDLVRRIKTVNPDAEVILYMYTPVPLESELFATATRLGFRFPETLDEWVSGDWSSFALRRNPGDLWLHGRLRRRVRNFERVLNAYYPTVTDSNLSGAKRAVLRGLGAWRYKLRFYAAPYELRVFQRLFGYQRPETTGF